MTQQNATNFEDAIVAQFRANPAWQVAHPLLWHILSGPSSPRRSRRIARMEEEVRSRLGKGPHDAIDWKSIDWLRVLQWIVAILSLLLLI